MKNSKGYVSFLLWNFLPYKYIGLINQENWRIKIRVIPESIGEIPREKVDFLSKMTILDLKSVKPKILDILDSGVVFPGRHCKDQMLRRQVFMPDIKEALSIGEVKPGQADGDDANCIFRVYGADVEGDPLIVVVKIDFDKKEIECITVF